MKWIIFYRLDSVLILRKKLEDMCMSCIIHSKLWLVRPWIKVKYLSKKCTKITTNISNRVNTFNYHKKPNLVELLFFARIRIVQFFLFTFYV